MNVDDIHMGEYCRNIIRLLSQWYITFMTMFVSDVKIAVFVVFDRRTVEWSSQYKQIVEHFHWEKIKGDTTKCLVYAANLRSIRY